MHINIFYLFILFISIDENDLYQIDDFYIAANKIAVAEISGDLYRNEIYLFDEDRYISTHKFIKSRLMKKYIYLPKKIEKKHYQLYISKYNSEYIKPNSIDIKIINIDQNDVNYFEALSIVSNYNNKSDEHKSESIRLIDNLFSNEKFKLNEELIVYKVSLLFEYRNYEQLINYLDRINIKKIENVFYSLKLKWYEATSLLNLHRLKESIICYKKIMDELKRIDIRNFQYEKIKAETLLYFGLAQSVRYFFDSNRYNDGYDNISNSMLLIKKLGDKWLNAESLYILGAYFSSKEQWLNALTYLELAETYSIEIKHYENLSGIYNQKAITYKNIGELNKSLFFYRKAIQQLKYFDQTQSIPFFLRAIGEIYEELGDYVQAKRYYSSYDLSFYQLDGFTIASILNDLGRIARLENNFVEAQEYHILSRDHYKYKQEKPYLKLTLEQSKNFYEIENYSKSQRLALMTLVLMNSDEENFWSIAKKFPKYTTSKLINVIQKSDSSYETHVEMMALLILAKIAFKNNDYKNLANLLLILQKNINLLSITDQFDFYQLQIEDYHSRALFDKRDNLYQEVLTKINNTRAQFDVSDLALHWTHQAQAIINKYVDVLFEQEKYQEIFDLLEKYYAINLREKRFNQTETIIKEKSEEIQQALDDYVRLEREVLLKEDDEKQRQADKAKEHFLALNSDGEGAPEKIALNYLSIQDVQANLREGQLLLRYYVNDNNAFVFVIDQQQWQVMEVPSQIELQPLIQQLITNIKNKDFKSLINNQFAAELLPLEHIQQGNYEKLIIIADGITNLIPFTMLNIGEEALYQPLTSIIDVERTYSASDYFTDIPESDHDKRSISIFANPVFLNDIDDGKIRDKVDKDNLLWTFDNLPSTGIDAQNITDIFNDFDIEFFTKSNATNKNFLSETNRNANIIHIGTHGFFNDKALDNVGIATSIIDDNGQRAPGALAMREILYQPFKANLAVVGGCETTRGKAINGEGFNSLSRGLLSQGVNAVIGTIWSIPDRATSVFMKEFYTNLRDLDGNVSQALNLSKRRFATHGKFRRYRHPYYWAGFVLTSSNRNISENIF